MHAFKRLYCFATLASLSIFTQACGNTPTQDHPSKLQEKKTDSPNLGTPSPILSGTQMWYTHSAAFRRNNSNSGERGAITDEAQSSGAICVKIDRVDDTALSQFAASPNETLVRARVKATDPTGSTPDFHTSDQKNLAATPAEIDMFFNALWLKKLTMPSQNTQYAIEKPVLFYTHHAALPNQTLSSLLFFDVRARTEELWSGWEYSDDMPGAKNYLNNFYGYFLAAPYGADFFNDATRFTREATTPPAHCDIFSEPATCARNGCTWNVPPGGNSSQCLSLYSVRVSFRDTLTEPPELNGPVVHMIEYAYDTRGILSSASEWIFPDTFQTLPSQNPGCGGACLNAVLVNNGAWGEHASGDNNAPTTQAPCAF